MEISYTQLKANGDRIVLERRESLVVERSDSKLVTRKQTLVREEFSYPSEASNTKNSVCKEKNHGYNSTEPKLYKFAKGEVLWQKRFNSLAHAIDTEIIKLKQKRDKIRKRIGPKGDNLKNHDVSVQCNIDDVKDITPSKTNVEVSIEKYSSEHKFACTSPRYALDEQTLCRPRMRTIGVQMSSRQSQRYNDNSIGVDKNDQAQIANHKKSNTTLQKKFEDKENNNKNSKIKTLLSPLPFDCLSGDPNEAVKLYHMQCALPLCKCNCQAVQACPPANSTAVVCNQKQYVERSMSPGREYNYCYNEYYCNYPNRCHQKSTALCCQPPKTALSSPCCQPCSPPCCVSDSGGRRNTDLNTDIFFHPTKCDDSCTCKPKLSKLEECRAENEKLKKIMLSIMKRKKRQGHSDTEKRRSCECCRSCEEKSKKKSNRVYKGAGDSNKRSKSQDDRQWEENLRKKLRKQSAAKIAKLLTRDANKDDDDRFMGSETPSSLHKSEEEDIIQTKKERRSRSAPQDDDCYCDCFKCYNQEPDLSTEAQQALKQMRISPYQAKAQSRRDKSIESRKPRQKRSSRRDNTEGEQSKPIQKKNETYSPQNKGKEQSYEEYINRYKEEPDSETLKRKQAKYDARQSQHTSKGYGDVIDSSTLPEEFIHEGTPTNLGRAHPYNPYQTSGEYIPEQMDPIYLYSDDPTYEQSFQGKSIISSPTNIEKFPRPSKDEYILHSTETARSSKSQPKSTARILLSKEKSSKAKSAPNKQGKQTSDLSSSDEKRAINAKNAFPKALELDQQPKMSTDDQQQIPMNQRKVLQKAPSIDVEEISQYSSKSHQNYKIPSAETSHPDHSHHKLDLPSKAQMPLHNLRKVPHQQEYAIHEQERKRLSDSQHRRLDDGKQIQNSPGTQQPHKLVYKNSSMEPSSPDFSNQTSFLQSKGPVPSKGSRSPPQTHGYSQRTYQGETDPQRERLCNIKQTPHSQSTQQSIKIDSPKYSPQPQLLFSQPEAVSNKRIDSNALSQSQSYFQQTSPNSRSTTPTYESQREFFQESQRSQSPQFPSQSQYQGITPSDIQPHALQSQTKFFSPEMVQSDHMDSDVTNQKQSYFAKTSQKPQPTTYGVQKRDFVNSQLCQPQSQSPLMEVSPNQSSQYQSKYSPHQRTPSPDSQHQQPLLRSQSNHTDPNVIKGTNFQQVVQTSSTYGTQEDRFENLQPYQPESQQPLPQSQNVHIDSNKTNTGNFHHAVQKSCPCTPRYSGQGNLCPDSQVKTTQALRISSKLSSNQYGDMSPSNMQKLSSHSKFLTPEIVDSGCMDPDVTIPKQFYGQLTLQKSQFICGIPKGRFEDSLPCQPQSQSPRIEVSPNQSLKYHSKHSPQQPLSQSQSNNEDFDAINQRTFQQTSQKSRSTTPPYDVKEGRFVDTRPCQPQSQSSPIEISPNLPSQYKTNSPSHQHSYSPDFQQPLLQTVQKSRPTSPTYDIQKDCLPDINEFYRQPKFLQTRDSQFQPTQFAPDISPYEQTQRACKRRIYQQQRLREPRPTTRIRGIQKYVPNLPQNRCKRVFLCPPTNKSIQVPSQQSLSDSDRTIFSCCRHRKSSSTKFLLKQPKYINTSIYDKYYSPVKRSSLSQRPTQNIVLFKDPCQFLPDSRNSSPHRNNLPETQSSQSYNEQVCFNNSENIMRRSSNLPQLIENSDQPFYPLPSSSQPLLNINTNQALGQQMQQLPSIKCFPDETPQPNRAHRPLSLNQQQFTHNIVYCLPDVSQQTNKIVSHGNFTQNSDLQQTLPKQNMHTNDYNDNYVEDNAHEEKLDYSDRECISKPSLISACGSDNGSWESARTTCFNGYDCNCQPTDDVEISETPPEFDACPCMFNTYVRLLSEYYDKEIIENAANCK